MSRFSKLVSGTIAAGLFAVMATSAVAQLADMKIIAPAAPGGGWDQTARSLQQAMTAARRRQKRAGDQRHRRGGTSVSPRSSIPKATAIN